MIEKTILVTWALIATIYALFASAMWWSRSDDCKRSDVRQSNLHDMLNRQFDAAREHREKIVELESTIEDIGKLCNTRKDGAK